MRLILVLALAFCLAACSTSGKNKGNYVPVVNANSPIVAHSVTPTQSQPVTPRPVVASHRVSQYPPIVPIKRSELPKRQKPKYQRVKYTPKKVVAKKAPVKSPVKKSMKSRWSWPAKGQVVKGYSSKNPGINIQGEIGEPVKAVSNGMVVYSQENVRDYGNLLIIKHPNGLLTAYAHNKDLLVKTGDRVKRGQTIANMGQGLNKRGLLHFEVRKNGQPVNPLNYLS